MAIAPISAANAYAQAAKAISETTQSSKGIDPQSKGPSFSELLSQTVDGIVESTKASEVETAKALTNEGDVLDVVTAVAEAELTVQTVVAVRDRVIEAYQRIMQMPI